MNNPADPIITKLAALRTSAEIDAAIADDDTLLDMYQDETTDIRDLLDSLIEQARTTAALLTGTPPATLTEGQALSLIQDIAHQHDFVASVWTLGDVNVRDDGEDYGDSGIELAPAERDAVANTWEWRKGIDATASERVGDMIPGIVRHYGPDGEQTGFTLDTIDETIRYNMDGTPSGGESA